MGEASSWSLSSLRVLTAHCHSFRSCFFVVLHDGDGKNANNVVFYRVLAMVPYIFLRFFVVFHADDGKIAKRVVFSRCCVTFLRFFDVFAYQIMTKPSPMARPDLILRPC